jgi:hypothetical protein
MPEIAEILSNPSEKASADPLPFIIRQHCQDEHLARCHLPATEANDGRIVFADPTYDIA